MTQPIRLSQFVITYGPGALLEGTNGPRVIPSADIGLFTGDRPGVTHGALEISDQRMSHGLLNGARIYRLPSNAEIGVGDNYYIYRTKPFPSWSLCLNSGAHGGRFAILYQAQDCPVCRQAGQRRQQSIRFVRACAEGHLDDVDWPRVVHRPGRNCPHRQYFRWHGIGGALNQIRLECPVCGDAEQLGNAYGREWTCSGRFPEREGLGQPAHRPGCPEVARIIQRQASNLRLPDLRTLFTIPPRSTELHTLLQSVAIRAVIAMLRRRNALDEQTFRAELDELANQGLLPRRTIQEIFDPRHPWTEIDQAINDVLTPIANNTRDLLLEEFHALLDASVHGAPPIHARPPAAHVVFEAHRADVRHVIGPNQRRLRVTPISRLRTVTVQIGYRREVPRGVAGAPASTVPVFSEHDNYRWYPGVEYLGEGLFIVLDDDEGWHFPMEGSAAPRWQTNHANPPANHYSDHLFRAPADKDELHPVFAWWHTLAHLLLRAVSLDAGYSSSSIRERVFIEFGENGRARGGVILYATQPGSEGTMGGLIALTPHFQGIVDRAMEMARSCSNDPLCAEQRFRAGEHNGASCYGCLLVSETSCEHRNLWLDRVLLQQNLP
jgi:hypothetical protein